MDYRAWITVPGIDIESDDAGFLLDVLDERFGSFGPVLSGVRNGVEVVLSTGGANGEDRARALMLGAVTDALLFGGFAEHPSGIRLERISGDVAVA
ncbi:MAG: hypothetical protein ACRDKH_06335 [Solirubrobacterales bacterium]